MKKRILSFLLTVCILLIMVPTTALATEAPSAAAFLSATTTGKNTIVLTMDKALTDGSHASANGFTVGGTLANGPVAVTNVAVLDTAVTLSLDKDLVYGDTIELSYDSGSAAVKLVGADGEVASFSGNSVTNALPQTVTLLSIADAIAPVNGGTPAALIAETDQYTGSVTWTGAPAQFAPSQPYTATITLTAKPGYTFEGIAADAFEVPCAMSATNGAGSGVITATFISPPNGYITDGNGVMAYKFITGEESYSDYGTFEIMGFFYNGWKQSTCGSIGFKTLYNNNGSLVNIDVSDISVVVGDTGLTMDVDIGFVSGGKALQIKYNVANPNLTDVENFSFGTSADVQIGSDDTARITLFETDKPATENRGFTVVSDSTSDRKGTVVAEYEFAQLNFFGKNSVGVTNVDTFWFGYWNSSRSNTFNQTSDTTYSDDSGMAYSWKNRTIGAGETRTYTVIIGIGGADSADLLGYSVSYYDNVPDAVITVPETQQKLENIALTISEQVPVRNGYTFNGWNTQADGNGTVYNPGDIYTPNASLTLYAKWAQNATYVSLYTITETAGVGGTITPFDILVTLGGAIMPYSMSLIEEYNNKTYTITPQTGYKISDVLVDGVSVGAIATYTFSSVTSSHTIEAKFEHDCPSKKFSDVDQSLWYHEGIDFVLLNGLFNGTTDTTFEPDADMTRAMLVTVLWRLDKEPEAAVANLFADVAEGTWCTDAVVWASENAIVKGYNEDAFGPNDPISREQMVTILYRYANYKGYDVETSTGLDAFSDADDVSAWALASMKWAVAKELNTGVSSTNIDPAGDASRAQVATILMRFMENVMN